MKPATPRKRPVRTRTPVDPRMVLDQLGRLPISTWSYTFDSKVRHIGPMAQDFQAVFDLGGEGRRIQLSDAVGIAYAAIQALHALLLENEQRIVALRGELKRLSAAPVSRGGAERRAPTHRGIPKRRRP